MVKKSLLNSIFIVLYHHVPEAGMRRVEEEQLGGHQLVGNNSCQAADKQGQRTHQATTNVQQALGIN